MTTKFTKITTAIATGAVLLSSVAPMAFAASTSIELSGNGAGSDNTASVNQTSTNTVSQNNVANVTNNVQTNANTGGNSSNFNTGNGSTTVDTGDANVTTNVSNDLNKNVADDSNCNCASSTDVLVSGNGALSNNTVGVTNSNTTSVQQGNNAQVRNDVSANATTGNNEAGFNTGSGNVTVRTGNANVTTNVSTDANANYAHVGSAGAGSDNGSSLKILNNGAGSTNYIGATIADSTTLGQNNLANIDNDVRANANTGDNNANFNTGDGSVVIDSGDANVDTTIDNSVNFNAADVDCGCVLGGLTAKIAGNGAVPEGLRSDARNTISANLTNAQVLGQGNNANLDNDFSDCIINTGNNEAGDNTAASVYSDPTVRTGNSNVTTGVSNSGNSNVIGSVPTFQMPDFQSSFDWSALIAFFGSHFQG